MVSETTKYVHPLLDSERWDHCRARPDDIVIATPFKSGTTCMQMIVLGLLRCIENPPLLREVEHRIDFRLAPLDAARSVPNILLVRYNDLLADALGEIERTAAFIGAEVSRAQAERLAIHTSFGRIENRLDELFPGSYGLSRGPTSTGL